MKYFDVHAPLPGEVIAAYPSTATETYWRVAPRFGVSHPVSDRTKVFFNYGIFYALQKPQHMYGMTTSNTRPGSIGRMEEMYNPNLRPSRTAMYEVGVEHVLPLGAVFKLTSYAKYNTDQVTKIEVTGAGFERYWTFRNANYEDVFGYEVQIARNSGRFLNGALSYERSSSRTGEVGYQRVADELNMFNTGGLPYVREQRPQGLFRAFLRLGTPLDWGLMDGGWSLGAVHEWRKGGERVYNPDAKERRELPPENIIPVEEFWNVDVKLSKRILLPRGRYVSAYLDVTNVLNIKRLNTAGVENYSDVYLEEVYRR
jgi:outer membrane receptor protein involved in Fe transport